MKILFGILAFSALGNNSCHATILNGKKKMKVLGEMMDFDPEEQFKEKVEVVQVSYDQLDKEDEELL